MHGHGWWSSIEKHGLKGFHHPMPWGDWNGEAETWLWTFWMDGESSHGFAETRSVIQMCHLMIGMFQTVRWWQNLWLLMTESADLCHLTSYWTSHFTLRGPKILLLKFWCIHTGYQPQAGLSQLTVWSYHSISAPSSPSCPCPSPQWDHSRPKSH